MNEMAQWCGGVLAWLMAGGDGSFAEFYSRSLRSDLFSGFLTLCAFLFSVKTFLLVTLEKDIYGTQEYHDRIKRLSKVNTKLTRYGQLRRLNKTLFWAVILTFCASIAQLTIGLASVNWASLVCLVLSVIAIIDVGYNLFVQRSVITDWLEFLEERSAGD